jgi:hypothetical protein
MGSFDNFQCLNKNGKGKGYPGTGHEDPERDSRYSSSLSLTSALDGDGCQRHAPVALPPRKTRCMGGWVAPGPV